MPMYVEKCVAAIRNIHGPTIQSRQLRRHSRNENNSSNRAKETDPVFVAVTTGNKTPWFVTLCSSNWFNPMSDNARFGFVNFAETWNGRLAMLGFVIGLGTELLTGQGILTQIGLS